MSDNSRIRYQRLNDVVGIALQKSIGKVQDWRRLSECFGDYSLTTEGQESLKYCQESLKTSWLESVKREFDDILQERNVKQKLDELDDLIMHAKERSRNLKDTEDQPSVNIDELSSEQLIEYNLQAERVKTIEELNKRLGTLETMNNELTEQLNNIHSNIRQEQKSLEEMYTVHLGASNNTLFDPVLENALHSMLFELKESNWQ